jgi:hypothetical protein
LIALALFAPKYKGDMRAFLDGAMHSLNQSWNLRGQQVEGLASELFSGVNAGLEIFGRELGRKIRGGKVESALNRANHSIGILGKIDEAENPVHVC